MAPRRSQRVWDRVSSEAAIDEELGGTPQGDADDVLSLGHRDVEVGSDVFEAVSGLKAVNGRSIRAPPVHNNGLAERLIRVDDNRR